MIRSGGTNSCGCEVGIAGAKIHLFVRRWILIFVVSDQVTCGLGLRPGWSFLRKPPGQGNSQIDTFFSCPPCSPNSAEQILLPLARLAHAAVWPTCRSR